MGMLDTWADGNHHEICGFNCLLLLTFLTLIITDFLVIIFVSSNMDLYLLIALLND